MKILNDNDLMPFGKYKGKTMQEVPAGYLHWLWHNGMKSKAATDSVAAYIQENMDALKDEDPDLIWN